VTQLYIKDAEVTAKDMIELLNGFKNLKSFSLSNCIYVKDEDQLDEDDSVYETGDNR